MYIYAHKFKTIDIKGNPVDQSSCKRFSELIHEYQVCSVSDSKRETINIQREKRRLTRPVKVN